MIPTGEQVLRVAEGLLAIMRAGGVPDQHAGWMLDRLAQYVDADAYEGALVELRLGATPRRSSASWARSAPTSPRCRATASHTSPPWWRR